MRCADYDKLDYAYYYWLKEGNIKNALEAKGYRDAHRAICPVCKLEMEWAASGPPNPPLMEEEMEATR